MTWARFAWQASIALAIMIAGNVGISVMARNSVARQVLAKGENSARASDLFVGSSTVAAGIDERAFEEIQSGHALNLGLGSTTAVEHLLIYRQQASHVGARLYYGFLDRQLTESPTGSWDTLKGNYALSYYVEPDIASGFYGRGSRAWALRHRAVGLVPMLVERHRIWAYVERLRRYAGEIGMPKKVVTRFGRVEDFVGIGGPPVAFAARCADAVERREPLSPPVAELFRLSRERGNPLYVVEMPIRESHRKLYYSTPEWQRYREWIVELVDDAGGIYVPAAGWIPDDGFRDTMHLTVNGSAEFSRKLARWTKERH